MLTPVSIALVCLFFFVFAWSLYNLPILVAGVRAARRSKKTVRKLSKSSSLPTFSIVVPVKNEGKVVGRLLDALSKLDYPADKKEIVLVEDGSTDGTLNTCQRYAEKRGLNIMVLQKPSSDGKSSALNYGIAHAKGEIVGIFDADSVPARDALLNVCGFFEDPTVAAVQGRTSSINADENMLTKFISHEETVWCEVYLQGKDVLSLFVHLKGSCQFIRREVLEKLNGFDEKALSEDMEISARLAKNGYKIRYASNVRSWQESPASVKSLFRQRTRWFRGTMEVAFKYGKLISKRSMRNLDAEMTLLGPFVLIATLAICLASFYALFESSPFSSPLQLLMDAPALIATLTMLLCGLALIFCSKSQRVKAKSFLWLPFIYFYCSLQALTSIYAVLLILLRRPRKWLKTEKEGVVTNADVALEAAEQRVFCALEKKLRGVVEETC
jgi:cellulose synthase/poly-beta-1,6-N-acetylglucosamine synthase-like glycosyltransferase